MDSNANLWPAANPLYRKLAINLPDFRMPFALSVGNKEMKSGCVIPATTHSITRCVFGFKKPPACRGIPAKKAEPAAVMVVFFRKSRLFIRC